MNETVLKEFYLLLDHLADGLDGGRKLADIGTRHGLPSRGVYFFFEPGELRPGLPDRYRVVRVGTHGLRTASKSTLFGRLAQHRGFQNGGGNHRGSVFRKHSGTAFLNRDKARDRCPSWGRGSNADAATKAAELWLERLVNSYIASMWVLWINVDDEPGPQSDRGFLERNAIGLLAGMEAASPNWLGRHAANPLIISSGLWNVNHVEESTERNFLSLLERWIEYTVRREYRPGRCRPS